MTIRWQDITEVSVTKAESDILVLLQNVGYEPSSWVEGAISGIGVKVGALVWSSLSQVAVALRDAGRNSTAKDYALETFSLSTFQNERSEARAALYRIELECEVGEGPHSLGIGDVVLQASSTGTTYRNIEDTDSYPITLLGGGIQALTFQAEEPGTESSVAASAIDTIVTTYAGVTIFSGTLTSVGVDEESDESLRERNSSKWGTLAEGEGINDLIENVCRSANSEIAQVAIDATNPRGPGTVDVYCASTVGAASGAAVSDAQDALDNRFFWGYEAAPAPTETLDITGTVYYLPTYSAADVEDAVEAALLEWLQTIPLGGFDYTSGLSDIVPVNNIEKIILNTKINGQEVVGTVALTVPAADVSVAAFGKVTQGTWSITYTAITS